MLTPPRRLVILAPNWLGDAVMALPLVADVRRAWPDTEIVVAARRSVAPLFAMVPGVSRTIGFSGSGGWRVFASVKQDAATLAAGGFDAALLLPNSFQAAWLASRAGIPARWGFARDLRGRLLTRVIARPGAGAHQAEYYQALAAGLGLPAGDRFARIDVPEDARSHARTFLDDAGLDHQGRFVVFAPGAAYGRAKQWLPKRFAELAVLLADRGIATVLVGSKADAPACREVVELARPAPGTTTRKPSDLSIACPIDVSGRTDLPTLAGLMAIADAVVANDSGAMHLAAAVGARVAAVFGPTDDRKTSPLRAGADARAPAILSTDVWCRPCMLRECPIDHRCMTGVSAHRVLEALEVS